MVRGFAYAITFGALIGTVGATSAYAELYWSPWVSEEGGSPPSYCGYDDAAVGFECRGSNCDDIRLLCETLPYDLQVDLSSLFWTPWFSEEEDGSHSGNCGYSLDYVVTGVKCAGRYCDEMSIECSKVVSYPVGGVTPDATTIYGSANHPYANPNPPYSEEDGPLDFGPNHYLWSVTCWGSYCDDLAVNIIAFSDPAIDCNLSASCGGQTPGGCWCDDLCVVYGDCCADAPYCP